MIQPPRRWTRATFRSELLRLFHNVPVVGRLLRALNERPRILVKFIHALTPDTWLFGLAGYLRLCFGDNLDVNHVKLARYPRAYAKTMVEKELEIPFKPGTVKVPEALTMGASYMVAAIIPLVSYFFLALRPAFIVSLGLTFLALVLLGYVKGRLAALNLVRSVGEVLAVGLVSGVGGYALGAYLPRLFGY